MKIGIGVITCGVRTLNENILKYDPYVFVDEERKGSAYAKNEVLHKLVGDGCDWIFIFDDDCYPVIDGWQDMIIQWMKNNNVHYLAGMDFKGINIEKAIGDVLFSENPFVGAFYCFDKTCIHETGYFNEEYQKYGWEDVAYSIRENRGNRYWKLPVWINMYIHSMDMFAENNVQNMDQQTKNKYIEINRPVFESEIRGKKYIGYAR